MIPANSNTTPIDTTTKPFSPKPIQLNVKVLADNTANGWTNSGFHVKKGQKFRVTARGDIWLGNGNFAKPDGIRSLPDDKKLMTNEPTGGLIAVIGDDNNDFIFIGAEREFTAMHDGMLFFGVNENNLNDNSGSFEVTIEINTDDATTNIKPKSTGDIQYINAGILNNIAVSLPKPEYPLTAQQMNASGRVRVEVTIDEEGNVLTAKAVNGHMLLRNPAESAARGAKFKPVKVGNQVFRATGVILYNFINDRQVPAN